MGIHSAQAVMLLAAEREIGHLATRAVTWMALAVLDYENEYGHPARVYYKGREDLALGLGYRAPENASSAAFKAVDRALTELTTAGLVRCVEPGRGGRRSRYELMVPPAPERQNHRPRNVVSIDRGRTTDEGSRSLF